MSDLSPAVPLPAPRLEGDPPVAALPAADLTEAQVADLLDGPGTADLLDRLGIVGEDREDLALLIPAVLADPELLAEVTRTANLLRAGAGLDAALADIASLKVAHDTLQLRVRAGEGLIPILSLAAGTDVVRAWHAARGLTDEQSWLVLADLGQQMRVHRRSRGRLGLHQLGWTALNWRGRLFQLGRLQFDLHRTDRGTPRERWVVGTHIPARGPLDPAAVDASLDEATAFFAARFADLGTDRPAEAPSFGREFVCDSWLMSRTLVDELGAASNLGAFAGRWDILETVRGDDSAAFFVFGALPPYDAQSLPRRTRLERVVAQRLADGRGWDSGVGRLVR